MTYSHVDNLIYTTAFREIINRFRLRKVQHEECGYHTDDEYTTRETYTLLAATR